MLETPGSLADLAVASVRFAARWLRSSAEVVRASELAGSPSTLARVVEAAGVEVLLTLPESAERDARAAGVPVRVLRFDPPAYRQTHPGPGLGILDLLMAHGPASADVLRRGTHLD